MLTLLSRGPTLTLNIILLEIPLISSIGNRIFFLGLILLVLAVIVGMPAGLVIAAVSVLMMALGGWMWSKPKPQGSPENIPLSQQSAKNKIMAGVPAILIIVGSLFIEKEKATIRMVSLFLFAYALAGVIELILDKSYPNAKDQWGRLAGWKKFIISLIIIIASLIFFLSLIPFVAKLMYE